ncbi:MAG: hypothetical protein ORN54_08045 [Cyclobacteriaceae bacterium]|nr:hypothetical protein [Cyclobacteriaceae bacterium]
MKDSLKEFVSQNRDGFDSQVPPNGVWQQIERHLPTKSVTLWNSVVVWRAAAIFLFGVAVVAIFSSRDFKNDRGNRAKLQGEFIDLESYYSSQITEKKLLVNQFQLDTGLTEDEVTQNLQKLEAMYQVLKLEMEERPSEDVKDALVLNLIVRIDLLNQQLHKLDSQLPKKIPVNS